MTPLKEIRSFPKPLRDVLEQQFGVASAEQFYEHSARNAKGVQAALKVSSTKLAELVEVVKSHLSPSFLKRCRQVVVKRSRGVIVD